MKHEILQKITESLKPTEKRAGLNSMGVSESFYNPYYLIGTCFEDIEELKSCNEKELKNLLKLANHASDVFY